MAENFQAVVDIKARTANALAEVKTLNKAVEKLKSDAAKGELRINNAKALASIQVAANAERAATAKSVSEHKAAQATKVADHAAANAKALADTKLTNAKALADHRSSLRDIAAARRDADKNSGSSNWGDKLSAGIQKAASSATSLASSAAKLPAPILAGAAAWAASNAAVLATGAAVGGLTVTVGALAAAALATNTRVAAAFTNTATTIRTRFAAMSEVLIPTFEGIASKATAVFTRSTPVIQSILTKTGPLLEQLSTGFLNAASNALPGFNSALGKSGPIIAGISKAAETLGTAAGEALNILTNDAEGTGKSIETMGDTFAEVVKDGATFINYLGRVADLLNKIKDNSFFASTSSKLNPTGNEKVQARIDQLNEQNRTNAFNTGIDILTGGATNLRVQNVINQQRDATRSRLQAQDEARKAAAISFAPKTFATGVDATELEKVYSPAVAAYKKWQDTSKAVTVSEAAEAHIRSENARSEASAREALADTQTRGLRAVVDAEKAVATAHKASQAAQESLNAARVEASRILQDMQRELRDIPDTEEAARLRVSEAKLALDTANLAPGENFTAAQLADRAKIEQDNAKTRAALDYKNAQEELSDTLDAGQARRQEIAAAEQAGIENAPVVLSAKENLTAALANETDAERNLGETRVQAAKDNQKALDNLNVTMADNQERANEAAAATQLLRDNEQEARTEADFLAKSLNYTTGQLADWIAKVDSVKPLVMDLIGGDTVLTGLDAVAIQLRAIQLMALDPKLTASKAAEQAGAEIAIPRSIDTRSVGRATGDIAFGKAEGGAIRGAGTPKSDSIHTMLSDGEYVQPTASVDYYGQNFMESVRQRKFPRFAKGGLVGGNWPYNFDIGGMDLKNTLEAGGIYERAKLAALASRISGVGTGIGLGSSTDYSFETILEVAKRFSPGAILTSGLRFTDSGYHSKGLAGDIVDAGNSASGMADIARSFFGVKESLLQLIHAGGGGYYVADGRDVGNSPYYDAATRAEHYNHVHIAARKDAMEALLRGGGGGSSTAGGDLGAWISRAIGITGVGEGWRSSLETLIARESGGNPRAINNTDINAINGDPSRGLMQTIGTTFEGYRDKSLVDDIYDPVANIVAGINYIRATYGDISNVQQANPNAAPLGYSDGGLVFDDGGILPQGRHVVNNKTGAPEALVNATNGVRLDDYSLAKLAQMLNRRPAQLSADGKVIAEITAEELVKGLR